MKNEELRMSAKQTSSDKISDFLVSCWYSAGAETMIVVSLNILSAPGILQSVGHALNKFTRDHLLRKERAAPVIYAEQELRPH